MGGGGIGWIDGPTIIDGAHIDQDAVGIHDEDVRRGLRPVKPADASVRIQEQRSWPRVSLIEKLLAQGQAWLREGRDEQALAAFSQVLQSQPGNAIAVEGRRVVLREWLLQADRDLGSGDLASAERLVDQVHSHDRAHLDLPAQSDPPV